MKTIILHNPSCSKSRQGVAYLEEKNVDFEIHNMIKQPIDKKQLKEVLNQLQMTAGELIRKKDAFFKENFNDKDLTEEDYLNIMVENPRLIERPIIIKDGKAVIGRPTENIDLLFP